MQVCLIKKVTYVKDTEMSEPPFKISFINRDGKPFLLFPRGTISNVCDYINYFFIFCVFGILTFQISKRNYDAIKFRHKLTLCSGWTLQIFG